MPRLIITEGEIMLQEAMKTMVKYQVGEISFEQFAECVQIP